MAQQGYDLIKRAYRDIDDVLGDLVRMIPECELDDWVRRDVPPALSELIQQRLTEQGVEPAPQSATPAADSTEGRHHHGYGI
jgi:pyruvate carboxylase